MDDKEIIKDRAQKEELLETITAISGIVTSYMDDCMDDYREKPDIKTEWLNKKMR